VFYYEVAPADRAYKGLSLLTYCSDSSLSLGQIVVVRVRTQTITGFIVREVQKPDFSVKSIDYSYDKLVVPPTQIKFFENLNSYYPGNIGATAALFLPNITKNHKDPVISPYESDVEKHNTLPKLTHQQSQIYDQIIDSKTSTHVVHGDTGTGKTRLYLELAKHMNNKNKSVMILTPEISLTPQLSEQFIDQFNDVFLIHSKLSVRQKRDMWLAINSSKKPVVIIGARSALFSPVNNLGLIVLDEFHDNAYKQDQTPRYQAVRASAILSKISGSKLVLGSATPPVEDYFYALKAGAKLHRLTEQPNSYSVKRNVKIVKLNDPNERTSYDLISKTLLAMIASNLDKHQQTMVFLNKRGSSRTILCESCGWTMDCDRCNIPYIYHADKHSLICHTCNKKIDAPNNCMSCGSQSIIFKNPGTKAIESSLRKAFPNAKIGRYDKDNTPSETFATNYPSIKSGKIDILVGTQLLSKGHDLPKLSLVAILLAEGGLQFPDFSSKERNFQILHQIIGRVGRGHLDGEVLLQTLNEPETVIEKTEHKINTWTNFYEKELIERRKFRYPPFCFMLKIELSRASESNVIKNTESLATKISKDFPSVEIIGPGPALSDKKNNKWYWQIVVKSSKRSILGEIVRSLPKNCSYDLDPVDLL
jgi:primosomal protein N' (replication factor Y) (superfamily II helicase)